MLSASDKTSKTLKLGFEYILKQPGFSICLVEVESYMSSMSAGLTHISEVI
jgi:hypothetical protein